MAMAYLRVVQLKKLLACLAIDLQNLVDDGGGHTEDLFDDLSHVLSDDVAVNMLGYLVTSVWMHILCWTSSYAVN